MPTINIGSLTIERPATDGPVTIETPTSPSLYFMRSQHPPSAEIQTMSESHPHETNIEIGSLNVSPAAQSGISKQLAKSPGVISKVFQTRYFRLYRPLETWYERVLLFGAIVLSLAAGVPLPIIGVIFGYVSVFAVHSVHDT